VKALSFLLAIALAPLASAQSPLSNHVPISTDHGYGCGNPAISDTWYCQQFRAQTSGSADRSDITAALWTRAILRHTGAMVSGGHQIGHLTECDLWNAAGYMPGGYCLASEARILNKVAGAKWLFGYKSQLSTNTGEIENLYLFSASIEQNTGTVDNAFGFVAGGYSMGELGNWTGVQLNVPTGDVGYTVGLRIQPGHNLGMDVPTPIRIQSQDGSEDGYLTLSGGKLYWNGKEVLTAP